MRRVAIPIKNNRLSEYFGGCNFYEVYELDGSDVQKKTFELPSNSDVSRLPEWLSEKGVTDVIAYKIDSRIVSLFAEKKLNLFLGVPLEASDILIQKYLNGSLESDKNIIREITKI